MRRVLASIWQRNPKTWKVEGRQSQCNTSKIFLVGLTHLVDVNASEDPPGYRHPPYQGG